MLINEFLDELNEEQKQAVLYFKTPLLILAGAGSGKTRVLTYKIAYIISELNASPYSIFAVAFTNKAANEIKLRVENILNMNIRGLWIGTFHSMCLRIIKMYYRKLGRNYNFTILDSSDSKTLIKRIIKTLNYTEDLNYKVCKRTISNLKNSMIFPEDYSEIIENNTQSMIYEVYCEYENTLKKNNSFDFDSLLLEAYSIIKRDIDYREALQKQFKYILVDEYQDTNKVQYEFLKLLYSGNNHIMVVGDDDQSIYGFRGACIDNILNFDKDFPNTKIIKLEQNYRSTKKILKTASKIIANNTYRREKTLWSMHEEGENIDIISATTENEEAFKISKIILDRVSKGERLNQHTVFYRTNAQSRPFEEMFRKMNIPYTLIGGIKFFERKEIKDILSYLNVIVNPMDNISLKRIINIPSRGLGKKSVENIENISERENVSMYDIIENYEKYKDILSPITYRGLKKINNIFIQAIKLKDNVYNCMESIIKLTEYEHYLDTMPFLEGISRKENIQELLNSAMEFQKNSEDKSVNAYIDMISLYTDIDDYNNDENGVSLMTVHNAKGLEFDTVFIAGMEEGLFPHTNSIEENNIEEERRLFYVALTRARKKVYISYALTRNWYGSRNISGVSRFINELKTDDTTVKRDTETIKEKPIKDSIFAINDKIIHPYWGAGIIKGIKGKGDNTIAIIDFYSVGKKKIYVKYANLTRK